MTSAVADKMTHKAQEMLKKALHEVRMRLPYLGQLSFDILGIVDNRIKTAGITQNGRLFVNAHWFAPLSSSEAVYVTAHEIWHLMLRSHHRANRHDAKLVNIAHDWIINDILTDELNMPPPRNGLYLKGASQYSAEQLVRWLKNNEIPSYALLPTDITVFQDAFIEAGLVSQDKIDHRDFLPLEPSDVLSDADLIRIFGRDVPLRQDSLGDWKIRRGVKQAFSWRGFGLHTPSTPTAYASAPARYYNRLDTSIKAEFCGHIMPFELALQSGLDQTWLPRRSYGRASRRQASVDNIILAGRQTELRALIIVLDVSTSMHFILPKLLGAIKVSADACGLEHVRIIEVSMVVTHDEVVHISDLDAYEIHTEDLQRSARKPSGPHHAPSPWKMAKLTRGAKTKPRRSIYMRARHYGIRKPRRNITHVQEVRITETSSKSHHPVLDDSPPDKVTSPPPRYQMRENLTDLRPAFDYLDAEIMPEHIIVISDMQAYLPAQAPEYDVLWIDSGTAWEDTKTPSFGKVIRLSKEAFL